MQLRPLTVAELLDAAIKIYRSRARTLVLAVAVPMVPVVIFQTLVTWSTQPENYNPFDFSQSQETVDAGQALLQMTGSLIAMVAVVLASSLATAACFRAASGAYLGGEVTWRESLRFARTRLGSVLGLSIVVALATLLGLLCCFFGVIVPLVWFAVATPAMLMEGLGVGESMGRSRRLASTRFWPVLGAVLLSSLLAIIFQAIVTAPAIALYATDLPAVVTMSIEAILSIVAMVVTTPFVASFTLALYVDLRVRNEGFDLMLWARRLEVEATGPFPNQPGVSTWGPAVEPMAGPASHLPPPPPPPWAGSQLPPPPPPPPGDGPIH